MQDPDIGQDSDRGGFVMACNLMDLDGQPGGDFPTLENQARITGVFYHQGVQSGETDE